MRGSKRTEKSFVRIIAFIAVCLFIAGTAHAARRHKVLILNSYHKGHPWADNIVEAIQTEFNNSELNIEPVYEYMDMKRYRAKIVFPHLRTSYKLRYHRGEFDVIIVSNGGAIDFLFENYSFLFPKTPIVFCGIERGNVPTILKRLKGTKGITGVVEEVDVKGTADLALRLHPRAKRIVIVADHINPSHILFEQLRELKNQVKVPVEFVQTANVGSSARVKEMLSKLPGDSVILLSSSSNLRFGISTIAENVGRITGNCDLPVYTFWDDRITNGVIGGVVISGQMHGKTVAQMALRIIKGESANSIPVVTKSPNAIIVDYDQMKRFGISRSLLPKGTVILNESQSFYYRYKTHIWVVIVIITVLAVMNTILVVNMIRRKRAEEALQDERNLLRTIVDALPHYVYTKDTKGRFTLCNVALFRSLGAKKMDEVIGHTDFDFFPEEQAKQYCADEQQVIQSGEPLINKEEPYREQAGEKKWGLTTKVPLRDSHGELVGIVGVGRDITDRKRSEQKLKESEARYRALFEKSAEGIVVADIETRDFVYVNPAICEMLDYTEKELLEKGLTGIHPEDALEHVFSEFTAQAKGEKTLSEDVPCLKKDGTVIFVNVNTTRIVIDGKKCNVGFFTDITERKKTEEQLQKVSDELEARVEQRTADLAKANIDLRSEISERQKVEEQLLVYQEQLRSLASELSLSEEQLRRKMAINIHDNISQNLAISKMKLESLANFSSSSEVTKTLNEIHDLIAQTINSTRSLTFELSPPVLYELGFEAAMEWLVRQMRERHGIAAEFEDDGEPKEMKDNVRVLLFQAVRELLVNVAKHAKAKKVTVSSRSVNGNIKVCIEDDGVGFDPSKVDSELYKTRGGFGLFSIRERLGYMGGNINIESKEGEGTRITLEMLIGRKNGGV
ncbi:MAG: PAS domain S-box protein [Planctomycetes bacterium]|nr:PAS domain S-box protein [Planctomycetota bacterium]